MTNHSMCFEGKENEKLMDERYEQLGFDALWNVDGHAVLDVFQHLVVAQSLEREAAEGEDLVEQDAVGPNVRHRSEQTVH